MPYQLSVTANAISEMIAGEYRGRFGLAVPEWRVMAVLADEGNARQRKLVARTRMDKVAVHRACKQLEQRGLAVRSARVADGRSHYLNLTAAGREMHGEILPLALNMERRLFACLSAAELDRLKTVLGKLLERAGQFWPPSSSQTQ